MEALKSFGFNKHSQLNTEIKIKLENMHNAYSNASRQLTTNIIGCTQQQVGIIFGKLLEQIKLQNVLDEYNMLGLIQRWVLLLVMSPDNTMDAEQALRLVNSILHFVVTASELNNSDKRIFMQLSSSSAFKAGTFFKNSTDNVIERCYMVADKKTEAMDQYVYIIYHYWLCSLTTQLLRTHLYYRRSSIANYLFDCLKNNEKLPPDDIRFMINSLLRKAQKSLITIAREKSKSATPPRWHLGLFMQEFIKLGRNLLAIKLIDEQLLQLYVYLQQFYIICQVARFYSDKEINFNRTDPAIAYSVANQQKFNKLSTLEHNGAQQILKVLYYSTLEADKLNKIFEQIIRYARSQGWQETIIFQIHQEQTTFLSTMLDEQVQDKINTEVNGQIESIPEFARLNTRLYQEAFSNNTNDNIDKKNKSKQSLLACGCEFLEHIGIQYHVSWGNNHYDKQVENSLSVHRQSVEEYLNVENFISQAKIIDFGWGNTNNNSANLQYKHNNIQTSYDLTLFKFDDEELNLQPTQSQGYISLNALIEESKKYDKSQDSIKQVQMNWREYFEVELENNTGYDEDDCSIPLNQSITLEHHVHNNTYETAVINNNDEQIEEIILDQSLTIVNNEN